VPLAIGIYRGIYTVKLNNYYIIFILLMIGLVVYQGTAPASSADVSDRVRNTTSIGDLKIIEIYPQNSDILSSNNVFFFWTTSNNSSNNMIFIRNLNESNNTVYRNVTSGRTHFINLQGLIYGSIYEWHVESRTFDGKSISSKPRQFSIANGVSFAESHISSVSRNESFPRQSIIIPVRNGDAIKQEIYAEPLIDFVDLYLGFISGASDRDTVSLASGDRRDLVLEINAQDALKESYDIPIRLMNVNTKSVDYALIRLAIRQHLEKPINFDLINATTNEDKLNQIIRLRFKNYGESIFDFNMTLDEGLNSRVIVHPNHPIPNVIKSGETIDILVGPLWSKDNRDIRGNISISCSGKTRVQSVVFDHTAEMIRKKENESIKKMPIIGKAMLYYDLGGLWCINEGHFKSSFALPEGIGKTDIDYAYIEMDFVPQQIQVVPYVVNLELNDLPLSSGSSGQSSIMLDPSKFTGFPMHKVYDIKNQLKYSYNGPAENTFSLLTNIYGNYLTSLSNVRAVISIKDDKSLNQLPNIRKINGNLTVKIISPKNGDKLRLHEGSLVKAAVYCDGKNEPFCRVSASYNRGAGAVSLADTGLYQDDGLDDGIYANYVFPNRGPCQIKVEARNGAGYNYSMVNVTIYDTPIDACGPHSICLQNEQIYLDDEISFDNNSKILSSGRHKIYLESPLRNKDIYGNSNNSASISIRIIDPSNSKLIQNIKSISGAEEIPGTIKIEVDSSMNKRIEIKPSEELLIPDDPNIYGLKRIELRAKFLSGEFNDVVVNRDAYITPYALKLINRSGINIYRFSKEKSKIGENPQKIGIICSPEFEQFVSYNISSDPTITSFVAQLELEGLTELAQKYPNADVRIIGYDSDLSSNSLKDKISQVEWHVMDCRKRELVPLIVGIVPHTTMTFSNIKVTEAYEAAYMSYLMAKDLPNQVNWSAGNGKSKTMISDHFRSRQMIKPLTNEGKYTAEISTSSSKNDPIAMICKNGLPILKVAPVHSLSEGPTGETVYSIGPLRPVDNTYYVGLEANSLVLSVSMDSSRLCILIGPSRFFGLQLIGDKNGIKGILGGKQLTMDEMLKSPIINEIVPKEILEDLNASCVSFFQEFSEGYNEKIVETNMEEVLEPSGIFSILENIVEEIGSSPQPVYQSVQHIRETYPGTIQGTNILLSGASAFSSLIKLGKYSGVSLVPTVSGSPEILYYQGVENDISAILLKQDLLEVTNQFEYISPNTLSITDVRHQTHMVPLSIPMTLGGGLDKMGTILKFSDNLGQASSLVGFSTRQLYFIGPPNLGNSPSYDDPLKASPEQYFPSRFGITIESKAGILRLINYSLVFPKIEKIYLNNTTRRNLDIQVIANSYASALGSPQVPVMDIIIRSPANQIVKNVTIQRWDDSLLEDIDIPLTVVKADSEPMPGTYLRFGEWPLESGSWGSKQNDNSTYTAIRLFPFVYNGTGHWGRYYGSIRIAIEMANETNPANGKNEVLGENAKLKVEALPETITLGEGLKGNLAIKVYNDFSSRHKAEQVNISAEIPKMLDVASTDGTYSTDANGNGHVLWPLFDLGTDAENYSARFNIKLAPKGNIQEMIGCLMNISLEYEVRGSTVAAPKILHIPVLLIPSKTVDIEVAMAKGVRMMDDDSIGVNVTIKNIGKTRVTTIPLRMLIDGEKASNEVVSSLDSGEEKRIELLFKPLYGKHNLTIVAAAAPYEVNLSNNYLDIGQIAVEPAIEWSMILPGKWDEEGLSVAETDNGSYAVLGLIQGANGNRTMLIEISKNGTVEKRSIIGKMNATGISMQKTADGDYVIIGSRTNENALFGEQLWLVKVNMNGTINWQGDFGVQGNEYGKSVHETRDGGFIAAGLKQPKEVGYGHVIWLLKFKKEGKTWKNDWDNSFFTEKNATPCDVLDTKDGGYIIIGSKLPEWGDRNLLVLKTNSRGNQIWNRTFEFADDNPGASIVEVKNGGYVIAGHATNGNNDLDMLLLRINSEGDEMWRRIIGGPGNDAARSIVQTNDGGYIVAGYASNRTRGDKDAWLVKTDTFGRELWNRTYGGPEDDIAEAIQEDLNGSYIFTGSRTQNEKGEKKLWVQKINLRINVTT
jgi:hypothetical protein